MDGLTLRYKHRGQPKNCQQQKPINPPVTPIVEDHESITKVEKTENSLIPQQSEKNDVQTSYTRKRQGGRREKKNPKKSIPLKPNSINTTTEVITTTVTYEEDADLSFDDEDSINSRCAEKNRVSEFPIFLIFLLFLLLFQFFTLNDLSFL